MAAGLIGLVASIQLEVKCRSRSTLRMPLHFEECEAYAGPSLTLFIFAYSLNSRARSPIKNCQSTPETV